MVTYKSRGRSTEVDYILSDKCVADESVARQHRTVVCRMTLVVRKMKRTKAEQRMT